MSAWAIVLLGLGLAVDSALVALALGLRAGHRRVRAALAVGAVFGVVHGVLTLLGSAIGANVAEWFARIDHWIAFAVLAALGIKGLLEARHSDDAPRELAPWTVLAASVATSLDGVAVGFGMAVAGEPVNLIALSAAVATALGSTSTFLLGRHVPARGRRAAHIAAGLVLIGLGAGFLHSHLTEPS